MSVVRLAVALPDELGPAPERTKWIQIAYDGEFKGHHAGEFQFTVDIFKQMISTFHRNGVAVPMTYEHPDPGNGEPVPASGRIIDLEIRRDESNGRLCLMALARFTPRAWTFVEGEEYFSCSVVVDFESTDPVSGEGVGPELLELGLTNRPFLRGMKDLLAASRFGGTVATLTARTQPAPVRRSTTLITSPEILIPGIRRR